MDYGQFLIFIKSNIELLQFSDIHSLLVGDPCNSKGDGEKVWHFIRGTPPVAIMPETAWPRRTRSNHPTPSMKPISLNCPSLA